jgi:N-acetylneuraminate synthase
MAEIDEAVGTLREAGNDQIALLKCTSAYPAPLEEMNLRTIPHLTERFEAPVGLSDHTLGFESAIAAVALGACILEKHLTLSRHQPGPDSAFSMEPDEFKHLVASVRSAEKALGRVQYLVTARENSSKAFRRSLFVVLDMQAGEEFTELNLRCIRPGFGLHPRYLTEIFGRRAKREIPKGTPLSWDIID